MLPALFVIFYSLKKSKWTLEVFLETYGSLLQGTDFERRKEKIMLGAPCIYFFRRLCMTLFSILLREWLSLQLICLSCLSMVVLIFTLHVLPYQPRRLMLMESFNEIASLLFIHLSFTFTDSMADAQARSDLGITYIALFCANITVNILILFKDSFDKLKSRYRKKQGICCFRKAKKTSKVFKASTDETSS